MVLGNKILLFIAVISASCALNISSLSAAWWQEERLILPPDAQEEPGQENKLIGGAEYDTHYYVCSQDADSVRNFFRSQLPNYGWKERDMYKEFSKNPGFKVDNYTKSMMGKQLIFEKGDNLAIIMFFAPSLFSDKNTHFGLASGSLAEIKTKGKEEASLAPDSLTRPTKEVAPEYPGSSLMNFTEKEHSLRLSYFVPAQAEQAVDFYKSKMQEYGWELLDERPLGNVQEIDPNSKDLAKYCPNCSKEALEVGQATSMSLAEMVFSNERGDHCDVVISGIASGAQQAYSTGMTMVMINYEEK